MGVFPFFHQLNNRFLIPQSHPCPHCYTHTQTCAHTHMHTHAPPHASLWDKKPFISQMTPPLLQGYLHFFTPRVYLGLQPLGSDTYTCSQTHTHSIEKAGVEVGWAQGWETAMAKDGAGQWENEARPRVSPAVVRLQFCSCLLGPKMTCGPRMQQC